MPLVEMAGGYVLLWQEYGNVFAKRRRMTFLIVTAVVLCALAMWLVRSLGADVIQALLAVAMMTFTWNLLNRRPGKSMADDFGPW